MLLKSLMLIGAAALLSAGLARYWLLGVLPRAVMTVGLVGAACVALFSLLDVRATVLSVLPSADTALLVRYLRTTAHGEAVQVRIWLGIALAALLALPSARGGGVGVAFGVGALGLLATFSVISHAAAMGGWWPLASDLVHFVAAGAWAGGVFALALAPLWGRAEHGTLEAALRRMSALGLLTVLALTITGTVNALVHAGDARAFLASGYVTALAVKLALVVITVALAALNRFVLLPGLLAGADASRIRTAVSVEAVLLVAVLVATGWLSTTAVPHDMSSMGAGVDLIDNAAGVLRLLFGQE